MRERQELRKEKAREREKALRQASSRPDRAGKRLILYVDDSGDRDISEKIALGQAQPTMSKEGMYDARLFNQTSGMTSGFSASDAYNLYDKPLFNSTSSNIYKPTRQSDENAIAGVETSQFTELLNKGPSKGFKGTESTEEGGRSGPVVFEKEDVFGVDAFISAAKRGRDGDDKDEKRKSRK